VCHLLTLPHNKMRAQLRLLLCSSALVARQLCAPVGASPTQVPCAMVEKCCILCFRVLIPLLSTFKLLLTDFEHHSRRGCVARA
jgi:hypothetical protein